MIERETDFVKRLRKARSEAPTRSAESTCEVVRGVGEDTLALEELKTCSERACAALSDR